MQILITGAEGFIGLALVNLLVTELNTKNEIFCIIRNKESDVLPESRNIKIKDRKPLNNEILEFVKSKKNITDIDFSKNIVKTIKNL